MTLPFEEHAPREAYAVWAYIKTHACGIKNAKHAKEIMGAMGWVNERYLRKCIAYISDSLMGNGEPVLCSHSKLGYYIAETEEEKAVALKHIRRFTLSMLSRWRRLDKSLSLQQLHDELLLYEMGKKGDG